jgi:hypothetical protein
MELTGAKRQIHPLLNHPSKLLKQSLLPFAFPPAFCAVQPRGRKKIAHRFIGGLRIGMGLSPARDERNSPLSVQAFLKNLGASFE